MDLATRMSGDIPPLSVCLRGMKEENFTYTFIKQGNKGLLRKRKLSTALIEEALRNNARLLLTRSVVFFTVDFSAKVDVGLWVGV